MSPSRAPPRGMREEAKPQPPMTARKRKARRMMTMTTMMTRRMTIRAMEAAMETRTGQRLEVPRDKLLEEEET